MTLRLLPRLLACAIRRHPMAYLYAPTGRSVAPLYARETWCLTCWRRVA